MDGRRWASDHPEAAKAFGRLLAGDDKPRLEAQERVIRDLQQQLRGLTMQARREPATNGVPVTMLHTIAGVTEPAAITCAGANYLEDWE